MFCSSDTVPASTKTILSVAASLTFSAIALRLVDHIPDAIETFLFSRIRVLASRFTPTLTILIKDSNGFTPNHMFDASMVYLGTKLSPLTTKIDVHKPVKEEALVVNIDIDQELVDTYMGVKLKWILIASNTNPTNDKTRKAGKEFSKHQMRYFQVSFHKKHREMVLRSYLPWILKRAKEIRDERKVVKLHTVDYNGSDYWGAINLNHPATFDTMAMDRKLKEELMDDLDRFRNGNEYYRRVGRAWKRGYLLYGPPGTGKSSLVAAMANYLKYDVYDLDLNEVQCNSDLRRLLIGTGNKSIIVIEDIDFRKESSATDDEKITLSGLLNFIDGLWSCCGDERIIVFTTNHKDRLDPALLRPGRMDLHIHMSYCTFDGFKTLAFNYLQINESPLFGEVEHLLNKVQATPAEIAGELMKARDSQTALEGIIEFLHSKMDEGEEKASS